MQNTPHATGREERTPPVAELTREERDALRGARLRLKGQRAVTAPAHWGPGHIVLVTPCCGERSRVRKADIEHHIKAGWTITQTCGRGFQGNWRDSNGCDWRYTVQVVQEDDRIVDVVWTA